MFFYGKILKSTRQEIFFSYNSIYILYDAILNMAIISENQAAKLREANIQVPHVNENCIGCSACSTLSPDVFELNDEGMSEVVYMENYEGKDVDDAIAACPVAAISWRD